MSDETQPRWQHDPRSAAELFGVAKLELPNPASDEVFWETINILRRRAGGEVFQTARDWCASADAAEREIATRVLDQIGQPDKTYHAESVRLLIGLLADPVDAVVGAAAQGIGTARTRRAFRFCCRWSGTRMRTFVSA